MAGPLASHLGRREPFRRTALRRTPITVLYIQFPPGLVGRVPDDRLAVPIRRPNRFLPKHRHSSTASTVRADRSGRAPILEPVLPHADFCGVRFSRARSAFRAEAWPGHPEDRCTPTPTAYTFRSVAVGQTVFRQKVVSSVRRFKKNLPGATLHECSSLVHETITPQGTSSGNTTTLVRFLRDMPFHCLTARQPEAISSSLHHAA